MFRRFKHYTHTAVLVLAGAILLTACADLKNSMNQIRDRIADTESQQTRKSPETGPRGQAAGEEQDKAVERQAKKALECPEIKIIDELGEVHTFTDMNPPEENKRISTARLMSLEHDCRITNQGEGQVDLFMTFESGLGPAAKVEKDQGREIDYPYFIAVTNEKGEILSKDVFALTISPSPNTGVITARESIRQIIPLETPQDLAEHHIAIGFQMSDAQLRYNRKNMGPTATDKPEPITPDKRNQASEDAHKNLRYLRQ